MRLGSEPTQNSHPEYFLASQSVHILCAEFRVKCAYVSLVKGNCKGKRPIGEAMCLGYPSFPRSEGSSRTAVGGPTGQSHAP